MAWMGLVDGVVSRVRGRANKVVSSWVMIGVGLRGSE